MLLKAKDARPNDPTVYMQLAGYYNRRASSTRPSRPSSSARPGAEQPRGVLHDRHVLLGQGVPRLPATTEPRSASTSQKGIDASTRPSRSSPTTWRPWSTGACCCGSAPTWRRTGPSRSSYLKEADALRDRAKELQKQKSAGAGAGAGARRLGRLRSDCWPVAGDLRAASRFQTAVLKWDVMSAPADCSWTRNPCGRPRPEAVTRAGGPRDS